MHIGTTQYAVDIRRRKDGQLHSLYSLLYSLPIDILAK